MCSTIPRLAFLCRAHQISVRFTVVILWGKLMPTWNIIKTKHPSCVNITYVYYHWLSASNMVEALLTYKMTEWPCSRDFTSQLIRSPNDTSPVSCSEFNSPLLFLKKEHVNSLQKMEIDTKCLNHSISHWEKYTERATDMYYSSGQLNFNEIHIRKFKG